MAAITPVVPASAGSAFTPANASGGGDTFTNPRSNSLLYVNNGGAGSINVTITAQITARPGNPPFPPQTIPNLVVAVGAGVTKLIPIPRCYTSESTGLVSVAYSDATSVTVGVIQPE
ncbi:MAG TPA: hypothetical protein VK176_01700 [Phycisphaerales bacterium]|nr:hypothetical protein [Phycisphaerales bacterium]